MVGTEGNGGIAGWVSLLEEDDAELKLMALKEVNKVVDHHWPQVADALPEIDKLYEDETFSQPQLAALLASKVYYHLDEFGEALRYAMGAGPLFKVSDKSLYAMKIVETCIGEYVAKRREEYDEGKSVAIEPAMVSMVGDLLDACAGTSDERHGLGVAIDARRIDKVKHILVSSQNIFPLLQHCIKNSQNLIGSKAFRLEVAQLVAEIYRKFPPHELKPEYPHFCRCLFYLDDSDQIASILSDLLQKDLESELVAYQVAFDLVDLESQSFLHALLQNERLKVGISQEITEKREDGDDASAEIMGIQATPPPNPDLLPSTKLKRLRHILSGKCSVELHLQFLHRNNRADLLLFDQVKGQADQRNSIVHHGMVLAHAFLQAGTSSSAFLRPNLDWFKKAQNWAKFSATASLGVIHKGNFKECMSVLSAYLQRETGEGAGAYCQGGALYALGLINANHSDEKVKEYIVGELRKATEEPLHQGACLGLGLISMGEGSEELYEELKAIMVMDSAVGGEGAALSMGLLMLGRGDQRAIADLLDFSHDTQHEKIIRACSLAIALILYRKEEEADATIHELINDKDSFIRYGGMFALGLAYCATSKKFAVQTLLHYSVSDLSDDVRRAAVIALGFVLANQPHLIPSMLNLFAESYNPHVRYGAALALGISCAGSGDENAVRMMRPLLSDSANYVRQSAMIGMGLVLQQVPQQLSEAVAPFRESIMKSVSDKHEDAIGKFGALLAFGLLDAGGKNVSGSFFSKTHQLRREAVVGYFLFSQLWFWYPLVNAISLAFQPTAFIGVNKDLNIPTNFSIHTDKPEVFRYPPRTQKLAKQTKKETIHAVLSTSAKRQARLAKKKALQAKESGEKKEGDPPVGEGDIVMGDGSNPATDVTGDVKTEEVQKKDVKDETKDEKMEGKDEKMEEKDEKKEDDKKKNEQNELDSKSKADRHILKNPCRILIPQQPHIRIPEDSRYLPIFPGRTSGFVVLSDTRPDEPEQLVEGQNLGGNDKPVPVPEPFEWSG